MSKIKVGFIAPCVGVGGGDMFMLGLIRHAKMIECTGIAVKDHALPLQVEHTRQLCPDVKIFQKIDEKHPNMPRTNDPNIEYMDLGSAISAVAKEADVLISWCVTDSFHHIQGVNIPKIELIQNSDNWAHRCAMSNHGYATHFAGVSRAAVGVLPDELRMQAKTIYNGIDLTRCAPRFGREVVRANWGYKEDDKIILFMGRFVREKNPQSLLQALTKLPPNWKALFVGKGYYDQGLEDDAKRYVGADRVSFLEPQYHVGDILAASDAFMLDTDFEGLPLAVLEAWIAGLPVIVSKIDPMLEMTEIAGGPLATYVEQRATAQDLAEACIRATSESPEVDAEINLARTLVWQRLSIASISLQWEEYLTEVIFDHQKKRNRMQLKTLQEMQKMTDVVTHVKSIQPAV